MTGKPHIKIDQFWLAVALLLIFFWGEPDIQDAIIYWLTSGELK